MENTTFIGASDAPVGDSTINDYYDIPNKDIAYISTTVGATSTFTTTMEPNATSESNSGTYPSDLSNYQSLVGSLYFSDLHSAYEHAFRLADAVRASEEEVNDCGVYV